MQASPPYTHGVPPAKLTSSYNFVHNVTMGSSMQHITLSTCYGRCKVNKQYNHYSMLIQWDADDQIYVVTVPELPGCMTHGKTYEEAVRQGQDAIATWIDGSRELGLPIPDSWYHLVSINRNVDPPGAQ